MLAAAGDGQPGRGRARPRRPSRRGCRAARRRAWVVCCGQPGTCTRPPVTRAAARNGAALDRSGSTCDVEGVDLARARPARCARRRRRRRRRRRAASRRSSRCAAGSARACRRGARRRPRRSGRRRAAAPETNCEDADASMVTAPPRTAPRAAHGERQAAAAVVVDLDAEGAQRAEHRCHRALPGVRVAVEAHRRRRPAPATGGTNRITVPASPQSTVAAAAQRRRASTSQSAVVDVARSTRAQGAQRRGHQQGVARAQRCGAAGDVVRRARPARGSGWSATCCPGRTTRASTGPGGGGSRPVEPIGMLRLDRLQLRPRGRAACASVLAPRGGSGGRLARAALSPGHGGRGRPARACPRCRRRRGAGRRAGRGS